MFVATCFGIDGTSLISGLTYIVLFIFDNNANLSC
jgi:hypothetical protein